MPETGSHPTASSASQSVSIASQRTVAQKPRGTAWFRGGKEDFKKAWISIEWMNGCLNNSTKDAARALPDTTFGCGNPPSTTAVLPRADLGFTCRRKSLGTDQALRSSGARRLRNQPRKPGVRYSATSSFAQPLSARQNARSPLYIQHHHHPGASPEGFTLA